MKSFILWSMMDIPLWLCYSNTHCDSQQSSHPAASFDVTIHNSYTCIGCGHTPVPQGEIT